MPQDFNLNIDGVDYDLNWDKPAPPTQTDIQSVVNRARSSPTHYQNAFLNPRDASTEAAVSDYTQRWLTGDNKSTPKQLLNKAVTLAPNARYDVLPANLSPVGKLAIMRQAYNIAGNGSGTISAAPAPGKPNLLSKAATAVGDIVSTPAAVVKAAVQPADRKLADMVVNSGFGYESRTPGDIAEQARVASLPFLQKAKTLQHQDLRALAQPQKAADLQNAYQNQSYPNQLLESVGGLTSNLAADPLTWLTAGTAPLLAARPGLAKAITGGFVGSQALPYAADPSKIAADPAGAIPAGAMMLLGALHLASPNHVPPTAPVEAPPVDLAQATAGYHPSDVATPPNEYRQSKYGDVTGFDNPTYNPQAPLRPTVSELVDHAPLRRPAPARPSNAPVTEGTGAAAPAGLDSYLADLETQARANLAGRKQTAPAPVAVNPAEPLPPLNALHGAPGVSYTGDNTPIQHHYAVVSAPDLVTSHTDGGAINPNYDPDLQPRDRSRLASESQISDIATRLNPERLGESASTADGAPIVGPDGQVESGNGRTLAIRRAYQQGLPGAEAYREYLHRNAAKFGLSPQDIAGIPDPVLVRVRDTRLTPEDRAAFANEAGKSGVSAMSDVENAQNDARQLTQSGLLAHYVPDESGNVGSAANVPFVREFLARVVNPSEHGNFIQPDGSLSAPGARRIRNALLAAAYDDPHTLGRMLESTDSNTRTTGAAMLSAAPKLALLKEAIAKGERYPLDISSDLTEAANTLSHLREQGTPVETHLAQTSMFGEGISPVGKELLRIMEEYKRSGKKLGAVLNGYADLVNLLGDPKQQSMFGQETPNALSILEAARKVAERNVHENNQPRLAYEGQSEPRQAPDANAAEPLRADGRSATERGGSAPRGSEQSADGGRAQASDTRPAEGAKAGVTVTLHVNEVGRLQQKLGMGYDSPLVQKIEAARENIGNLKLFKLDVTPEERAALQEAAAKITPEEHAFDKSNAASLRKRLVGTKSPGEEQASLTLDTAEPVSAPSKLDAIEQAAKDRLQSRKRGLNSGVDPADLADLATIGAVKIARGAVTFAEFSRRMIEEFGEGVRPHLQSLYQQSLDHYHEQIAPRFKLPRVEPSESLDSDTRKPQEAANASVQAKYAPSPREALRNAKQRGKHQSRPTEHGRRSQGQSSGDGAEYGCRHRTRTWWTYLQRRNEAGGCRFGTAAETVEARSAWRTGGLLPRRASFAHRYCGENPLCRTGVS